VGSRRCRSSVACCTLIASGNRLPNARIHLSASFPVADFGISQAPRGSSLTAPSYRDVVHTVPFGTTYCSISAANIVRSRACGRRSTAGLGDAVALTVLSVFTAMLTRAALHRSAS
jgi:hypothetical protein